MNPDRRNLYILLGIITASVFLLILWKLPQSQSDAYRAKFSPAEIEKFTAQEKNQFERNAADIENSTRLTLAQIIGGLALLSGLYFTYQNVKTAQANLRITEEGKLTDRFSNAVELLGSEKLDVRLGGIYALERIARDSQKDHWTVMEVLTAFVREHSHKKFQEENSKEIPKAQEDSWTEFIEKEIAEEIKVRPPEDIQAIMTVIGRRKWSETETQSLNLQKVNLAGCVLTKANLHEANLLEACLSKANLSRANLSRANLSRANLSRAFLIEADLSVAILNFANLNDAKLEDANLSSAFLDGTNLRRADLSDANLSGVLLRRVDFDEASLFGADLSGANLSFSPSLTLKQVLSAEYFDRAGLSPELEKEFEEWQAKQTKKIQDFRRDSSDDEKKS